MKPTRYKVNEQFSSIQGEGLMTGVAATFIRLQGCPVGCVWCDSGPLADELEGKRRTNGMTANTWGAGGEWQTVTEILAKVTTKHVIITGGEPTIWNLDPLIEALRFMDCVIQLETSGLNHLKGTLTPDWITWSPKERLSYQAPMAIKNIANEVKFVIDEMIRPSDIQKIVDYYYYENVGLLKAFVLMPEGCPPGVDSISKTMDLVTGSEVNWHGFPVRFGDRLQYRLGVR